MIVCVVRDAAGNRAEIKTLFHTTGVKRSVVEVPVAPEDREVSFKDDILPIFKERCQKCHRPRLRGTGRDGIPPAGRLDLTSYTSAMRGAVIDPGWSEDSPIVIRISTTALARMPPEGPRLSEEQIQLIIDWIDEGAKNN